MINRASNEDEVMGCIGEMVTELEQCSGGLVEQLQVNLHRSA